MWSSDEFRGDSGGCRGLRDKFTVREATDLITVCHMVQAVNEVLGGGFPATAEAAASSGRGNSQRCGPLRSVHSFN